MLTKIVSTSVCRHVWVWPGQTLLSTLPLLSTPTLLACLPAYVCLAHTNAEGWRLVLGQQGMPHPWLPPPQVIHVSGNLSTGFTMWQCPIPDLSESSPISGLEFMPWLGWGEREPFRKGIAPGMRAVGGREKKEVNEELRGGGRFVNGGGCCQSGYFGGGFYWRIIVGGDSHAPTHLAGNAKNARHWGPLPGPFLSAVCSTQP